MNMKTVQTYRNLIVWQKSIDLTQEIYKITEKLPDDERFGLVSQMRRCAVSIASNIAEEREKIMQTSYKQVSVLFMRLKHSWRFQKGCIIEKAT